MNRMTSKFARYTCALTAMLFAGSAFAHSGHGTHGGWAAGLLHPLTGIDHLLVAVCVGVLAGSFSGRPAVRPMAVFLGALAVGLLVGLTGIGIPAGVETLIALSVLAAGVLVAWQSAAIDRVLWVLLCGFGALHGLVHGGEAPASIGGLAYAAGIVASTGTLSLAGAWVAGKVSSARAGQLMLRGGGAATAFAGLAFLLS